jgi:hypothetical protein
MISLFAPSSPNAIGPGNQYGSQQRCEAAPKYENWVKEFESRDPVSIYMIHRDDCIDDRVGQVH